MRIFPDFKNQFLRLLAAIPALLRASTWAFAILRGFIPGSAFIKGMELGPIISTPTMASKALVFARTSPDKKEGLFIDTLRDEISLSFFRSCRSRRFLNQASGGALRDAVIG